MWESGVPGLVGCIIKAVVLHGKGLVASAITSVRSGPSRLGCTVETVACAVAPLIVWFWILTPLVVHHELIVINYATCLQPLHNSHNHWGSTDPNTDSEAIQGFVSPSYTTGNYIQGAPACISSKRTYASWHESAPSHIHLIRELPPTALAFCQS